MRSVFRRTAIACALASPALAGPSAGNLSKQGDALGGSLALAYGGAPSLPFALVPSLLAGPNPILVALTGDPNDLLGVGSDLLLAGLHFQGATNGAGTASLAIPLPLDPTLLDLPVYFQGFGVNPGAGTPAGLFDEFSNVVVVTLNLPGRWQGALTDLSIDRALHTASALDDGRVLIAGGGPVVLADPWGSTASAEIYDPDLETHAPTATPLTTTRGFHAAAKLLDGRVLLAGGVDHGFHSPTPAEPNNYVTNVLASAEIFDPATGAFAATGPMGTPRAGHTATLLSDGRVLVTGGTKGNAQNQIDNVVDILNNALASAEVYDPSTGTFAPLPNMSQPKLGHAAVRLADGKVLVVSGVTVTLVLGIPIPSFSTACQRFDPAANAFAPAASLPSGQGRALFPAARLNDDRVLVAGGTGGGVFPPSAIVPVADARLFDSVANSWTPAGRLNQVRGSHAATLLPSGKVLVSGGAVGSLTTPQPIASCEIYDPGTNAFTVTGSMQEPHSTHTAVALNDGTVLVSGGAGGSGAAIASVETYTP